MKNILEDNIPTLSQEYFALLISSLDKAEEDMVGVSLESLSNIFSFKGL
jgi:hypothetical protein